MAVLSSILNEIDVTTWQELVDKCCSANTFQDGVLDPVLLVKACSQDAVGCLRSVDEYSISMVNGQPLREFVDSPMEHYVCVDATTTKTLMVMGHVDAISVIRIQRYSSHLFNLHPVVMQYNDEKPVVFPWALRDTVPIHK